MHVRKKKNGSLTGKIVTSAHGCVLFFTGSCQEFTAPTSLLMFILVLLLNSHSNFEIKHNHVRTEESKDLVSVQSHQTLQTTKYSWKNLLYAHVHRGFILLFFYVIIYLYSRTIQDRFLSVS